LRGALGSLPLSGEVTPLVSALFLAVQVNLLLAFFNLIPVPPLDGGNVVLGLLPPRMSAAYDGLRNYGFLILYALLFTGTASALIWPPTLFVARILLP
jgi:Zn-dependent protease